MLDLVFPRRCVACGVPGTDFCTACRNRLTLLRGPACARCCAPTAWPVTRCTECAGRRLGFTRVRAAVAYDDRARQLVAAWKERGLRGLAANAADLVCAAMPRPPVYTLTFVPSDPDRRLRRGYNPAELLARELSHRWQLAAPPLLVRVAGIRPQRGLPLAERRRNVRGAFRPAAAAPTSLALIDDVYTSGATVSAAASVLRKAGARRVEVVTFARAVR